MKKQRELLIALILAAVFAGGWCISAQLVRSPEDPFAINPVAFYLKYVFQSLFFAAAGSVIVFWLRTRCVRFANPLCLYLKLLCLVPVPVFWITFFLTFGWTMWKVWVIKNLWIFAIPGCLFAILDEKEIVQ